MTKTDSTGTTTYASDFENRLASVTLPGTGGTVSFKYDPFGRRIYKFSSSGTSVYAYDGDNLVEETNGSGGVVARYSQGLNIDEPLAMLRSSTASYYQADGLGSVTSLTNAAGTAAQNYTYDSFGNIIATTGSLVNSFRYTGREWDTETSLYYYRARYYDPQEGRFIKEDRLAFGGDGVNFYRYALNNSVLFRDPSGLTVTCYYAQNTGQLVCFNDANGEQVVNIDNAYSGGYGGKVPDSVNNSDYQYTPFTGPLPWGNYGIGPATTSKGPLTLPLTPLPGTNTAGRNLLRMHGDNSCQCHSASEGCIIAPYKARKIINDLGGGTITVEPTLPKSTGNPCQGGVCRT